MMKISPVKVLCSGHTIAVFALTLMSSALSNAAPEAPAVTDATPPLEFQKETSLSVKVSFEAKRRPLHDLLLDLKKQSGVTLTVADGLLTDARVTARVQEMALSEVLSAFDRLYGVTWIKVGDKEYTMKSAGLSEADMKMLQVGDAKWLRYWQTGIVLPPTLTRKLRPDWAAEILPLVDPRALRSKSGVAFSTLPEEIQQGLRRYQEEKMAEEMVHDRYSASDESLADSGMLRIGQGGPIAQQTPTGHVQVTSPFSVLLDAAGHPALLQFPWLPPAPTDVNAAVVQPQAESVSAPAHIER